MKHDAKNEQENVALNTLLLRFSVKTESRICIKKNFCEALLK
jgi:hypothetical protein